MERARDEAVQQLDNVVVERDVLLEEVERLMQSRDRAVTAESLFIKSFQFNCNSLKLHRAAFLHGALMLVQILGTIFTFLPGDKPSSSNLALLTLYSIGWMPFYMSRSCWPFSRR